LNLTRFFLASFLSLILSSPSFPFSFLVSTASSSSFQSSFLSQTLQP
jgi:hypothetical protein